MSILDPFNQKLPPAKLVVHEGDTEDVIVLDEVLLKALVVRALRDAGELVVELANQDSGATKEATQSLGEIVWDVPVDVINEAIQAEILRLVVAGLTLCLKDAIATPPSSTTPGPPLD
jgi:hypothetical protein